MIQITNIRKASSSYSRAARREKKKKKKKKLGSDMDELEASISWVFSKTGISQILHFWLRHCAAP